MTYLDPDQVRDRMEEYIADGWDYADAQDIVAREFGTTAKVVQMAYDCEI